MAKIIQFKALLGSKKTRVTVTDGLDVQMFLLETTGEKPDTLSVDVDAAKFSMKAKNLQGGPGSIAFTLADLDKSGSTPAIVGATVADVFDEITDNFFVKASTTGGSGGGAQTLTDGAAITMNFQKGATGHLTVNGEARVLSITNSSPGDHGSILVTQGVSGGTLVLPGVFPTIEYAGQPGEQDLLHFDNVDGVFYWSWQPYGTRYTVNVTLDVLVSADAVTDYPLGVLDANGIFLGVAHDQGEYVSLWNGAASNRLIGRIVADAAGPLLFKGTVGFSRSVLHVYLVEEVTLTNFADQTVPGFPVGIFANDGTFVGNAIDGPALVALLNASATYQIGNTWKTIPNGPSNTIAALRNANISALPVEFKAMRYWYVDAQGSANIYTSGANVIRKADGTQITASAGTLGTYTNFGLNILSYGARYTDVAPTANVPMVDTTSPYYINSLTFGTNYIYHNEDGEWAWLDVFGNCANNGGNVPPTVRFLAMQRFNADNNAVNISFGNLANLPYLTAVEAVSFNGIANTGGVIYNPAWMTYFPNLKTFQTINRSYIVNSLTDLGISKDVVPNLEFFGYRKSPTAVFNATAAEWLNMPPLVKGCDFAGAGLPVDGVDTVLNALATTMGTSNAYATARTTVQYQNNVRTSASDAAVATLTAKNFTVL